MSRRRKGAAPREKAEGAEPAAVAIRAARACFLPAERQR